MNVSWVRTDEEYSVVPVIAVFTKYDQFWLDIEMNLKDCGCPNPETRAPANAERVFKEEYLRNLGEAPRLCAWKVRSSRVYRYSRNNNLSSEMHETGQRCDELLVTTGHALNDGVVAVMLLAVQKGNPEVCQGIDYCN